ncbi:MAG: sigma-54-dependent Fis family transcriptional regulator [Acidobacteria bacterium]|nr:sigma-54-dependent Fis family transcriptional regulator [Acidobacteriota bacterium]MCB9398990.1 sigma-54-dependent Fis family transcriptional regulator [Acidobacteriota bacterium]
MDRYRIFHSIIGAADLTSMQSVMGCMLDQLILAFDVERGTYLSSGGGSLRCMAARTAMGSDIPNPMVQIPNEIIQKVVVSGNPFSAKMPIIPKNMSSASSWGGVQIKNILALPSEADGVLVGVTYLERKNNYPVFNQNEIDTISALVQDIEGIISNSRKYEKSVYEIDNLKNEIIMSKINMISQHPVMLRLFKQIAKLARVPTTVLIHGESGTGKELVARAIYNLSGLKGQFISMNCGGIEPNLMKSELFGHIKGSFTGAQKDRLGLFKKAEDGILFMDEIGEMPMDMQVALLRTLESGEILPVGADKPLHVNTRVIAATHRDLSEMVEEKTFRNDLYQRLKGITLVVPSLRERRSDIPLLADHFLKKYNEKFNLSYRGFTPEALTVLTGRDFQAGNVRELQHVIERAMVFEEDSEMIGPDFLSAEQENGQESNGTRSFEDRVNDYARRILLEAIEVAQGNKTKAMKALDIPRTTFYSMLNRYGISLDGDET